jgi:hypothetical protein
MKPPKPNQLCEHQWTNHFDVVFRCTLLKGHDNPNKHQGSPVNIREYWEKLLVYSREKNYPQFERLATEKLKELDKVKPRK